MLFVRYVLYDISDRSIWLEYEQYIPSKSSPQLEIHIAIPDSISQMRHGTLI